MSTATTDVATASNRKGVARGATRAAGVYIMIVEDRVYLFTDATVNIEPTAKPAALGTKKADVVFELARVPVVATYVVHDLRLPVRCHPTADAFASLDAHALGCGICVDITQDTMRLLKQGKTVPEIKTIVDQTYSQYGPSNIP